MCHPQRGLDPQSDKLSMPQVIIKPFCTSKHKSSANRQTAQCPRCVYSLSSAEPAFLRTPSTPWMTYSSEQLALGVDEPPVLTLQGTGLFKLEGLCMNGLLRARSEEGLWASVGKRSQLSCYLESSWLFPEPFLSTFNSCSTSLQPGSLSLSLPSQQRCKLDPEPISHLTDVRTHL